MTDNTDTPVKDSKSLIDILTPKKGNEQQLRFLDLINKVRNYNFSIAERLLSESGELSSQGYDKFFEFFENGIMKFKEISDKRARWRMLEFLFNKEGFKIYQKNPLYFEKIPQLVNALGDVYSFVEEWEVDETLYSLYKISNFLAGQESDENTLEKITSWVQDIKEMTLEYKINPNLFLGVMSNEERDLLFDAVEKEVKQRLSMAFVRLSGELVNSKNKRFLSNLEKYFSVMPKVLSNILNFYLPELAEGINNDEFAKNSLINAVFEAKKGNRDGLKNYVRNYTSHLISDVSNEAEMNDPLVGYIREITSIHICNAE